MSIRIDILSAVPKLLASPLSESILKIAQEKKLAEIVVHDLRTFTHDKHHTLDESPYGGGAGMILKPEPIVECIESLQAQRTYDEIVYVSADGEQFTQKIANDLSLKSNVMILCGHYKGIDQRVRDHFITREISIGDYVLSGGELAAAVLVDAIGRLLPGVLNDETSALSDSFQDNLLAPPVYTRPEIFRDWKVPDILMSGNHAKIEEWRHEQSLQRTRERRPDILD